MIVALYRFVTRRRRIAKLFKALTQGGHQFRSLAALMSAAGIRDREYAKVLLAAVGARQAVGKPDYYGLVACVGKAPKANPKRKLKKMLSGQYKWRKLDTLAAAIGKSADETIALLTEVGARAARRQRIGSGSLWGLESRVGSGVRSRY
jgi:hypothetical protein